MIFKEMAPLTFQHSDEAGIPGIPFDPDWERYFYFEDMGVLHIMTARRGARLIGYAACLTMPHVDARTVPFAQIKAIWLDKAFRNSPVGLELIRTAVKELEAKGAKLVHVAAKHERLGKVLQRLGFSPLETVYTRSLNVK